MELTRVRLIGVNTDTEVDLSLSRAPVEGDWVLINNAPVIISKVMLVGGGGAVAYTESAYNLDKL